MRQQAITCDLCGGEITGPHLLVRLRQTGEDDLPAEMPELLQRLAIAPGRQGELCYACCIEAFDWPPVDGKAT